MFRLRTSLDRRRVLSERRLPASRNNHVAHCEVLEDRRMLTLVWANRGDASDMFDDAFGDNAEVARGVVDSALNEWNRVVVGYDAIPRLVGRPTACAICARCSFMNWGTRWESPRARR